MIHGLVGWDKEAAIWWAGACELALHFDWMVFWVRSPFPPAHRGLTHASPTLRADESPRLDDGRWKQQARSLSLVPRCPVRPQIVQFSCRAARKNRSDRSTIGPV